MLSALRVNTFQLNVKMGSSTLNRLRSVLRESTSAVGCKDLSGTINQHEQDVERACSTASMHTW